MLLKSENCDRCCNGYYVNQNALTNQLPLRIISTGHVVAQPPFFTTRSERPDYQLIYTREGTATITVNGITAPMGKDSVVVIDCMKLHDYRTASSEPWIYDFIHFNGSGVKLYEPYLLDTLHVMQNTDASVFKHAFDIILGQQLRNDILSCSQTLTLIASMLNALMEARERPDLPSNSIAESLNPAVKYVHENYNAEISIDTLSELCFLSKYYFIRRFRQVTGESPHQYLIKVRISEAKKLLAQSNDSIEQIALGVGFSNYSSFVTQFKRLTNVTPREYRSALIEHRGEHFLNGQKMPL